MTNQNKFALCNEAYGSGVDFADVCRRIKSHGYDGIEIAPFTLAEDIRELSGDARSEIRKTAAGEGLEIVGLHWCLRSPAGLHVNTREQAVRERTGAFYRELIRFCAELGGKVMVHGSPAQRNWEPGEPYQAAFARTVEFFASCMPVAEDCGVDVLIEPLAHNETNMINRAQDGRELIEAVGSGNFGLHLDVKAMCGAEYESPAAVIRKFGHLMRHFHANDPDGRGPGLGTVDHAPIAAALKALDYKGWVSVEVFDYTPDPDTVAAQGMVCLRNVYT